MNAVRLERRVWTVLLDQTSLAGVLELGRRETLLVRIGVVLKKRSVSGWRLRRDKAIVSATRARGVLTASETETRRRLKGRQAADPCPAERVRRAASGGRK